MAKEERKIEEEVKELLAAIEQGDADQGEFLQAVDEVLSTMTPLFVKRPEYLHVARVIAEPERVVQFRVPWVDDQGVQRINRGFRVQFNSAIGPYKGGLRFHPSVNLSIVKFLGFEQVFKNALTTLPMGGGKGGSNFDPRGKSDLEVLRFTQSFMTELYRHVGADTDVPAGDIGVGGREIGFLNGQYKRITGIHSGGVLTGKGHGWGGSLIRPEATGYGVAFISRAYLREQRGETFEGKRVLLSGAGNVATFCAQKLTELGAKVLTLSDSGGYVYEPAGFTQAQLDWIIELKTVRRGRISEYAKHSATATYHAGERPWRAGIAADFVAPCATQNELDLDDAKALVEKSGVTLVAEGANMPSTTPAIHHFKSNKVGFIPAKAANAGGVATSGLEMSQNSLRYNWTRKEVELKLVNIMEDIFQQCVEAAAEVGKPGDIQLGANVAGFKKVADAMLAQGMAFVKSS